MDCCLIDRKDNNRYYETENIETYFTGQINPGFICPVF